jgi:hypothetical protein
MRLRYVLLLTGAAWGAVLWGACSRDRGGSGGGETSSERASSAAQFMSDGANICGNEFHDAQTKHPLLYFVLDRSGSMAAPDGGVSRYERMRQGVLDFTDALGAQIRAGAALFPAPGSGPGTECAAGAEVYAPTVDPGPNFAEAIDVFPNGGTPTAATLQALRPRMLAEASPKVVLLATDGGPNCNAQASCSAAECILNLEGECPTSVGNCCAPPDGLVENCLDRAATLAAITALKDEGSNVYVIGIPGSEIFGTVLNQMALAGGVAQDGATYYYRVDDLSLLSEVFKDIARDLISCTFDLTDPPEEMGLTNVYLNGQVVPLDPENGWIWVDGDTVELVGAACDALKSGSVQEVQIVSGCPTETPL